MSTKTSSMNTDLTITKLLTVKGSEQDRFKNLDRVEAASHSHNDDDASSSLSTLTSVTSPSATEPSKVELAKKPSKDTSLTENASPKLKRNDKHKHHHHHHHNGKQHHHRHRHHCHHHHNHRHRIKNASQLQPTVICRKVSNNEGNTINTNTLANVSYEIDTKTALIDDQQAPLVVYRTADIPESLVTDGISQPVFLDEDEEIKPSKRNIPLQSIENKLISQRVASADETQVGNFPPMVCAQPASSCINPCGVQQIERIYFEEDCCLPSPTVNYASSCCLPSPTVNYASNCCLPSPTVNYASDCCVLQQSNPCVCLPQQQPQLLLCTNQNSAQNYLCSSNSNFIQQTSVPQQQQQQLLLCTNPNSAQNYLCSSNNNFIQQTSVPQQQQQQLLLCTNPNSAQNYLCSSNNNFIQQTSVPQQQQQQIIYVDSASSSAIQPTIINQMPFLSSSNQPLLCVPQTPVQQTANFIIQQQPQIQAQPLQIVQAPQTQPAQYLQISSATPQVIQTIQAPPQGFGGSPQLLYQRPYDPVVIPYRNQQSVVAQAPGMSLSQPSYARPGPRMFQQALARTVAGRTGLPVPLSSSGSLPLLQSPMMGSYGRSPLASNPRALFTNASQTSARVPIVPLTAGGLLIPFQPSEEPKGMIHGSLPRAGGLSSNLQNFGNIRRQIEQRAHLLADLQRQNSNELSSLPVRSANAAIPPSPVFSRSTPLSPAGFSPSIPRPPSAFPLSVPAPSAGWSPYTPPSPSGFSPSIPQPPPAGIRSQTPFRNRNPFDTSSSSSARSSASSTLPASVAQPNPTGLVYSQPSFGGSPRGSTLSGPATGYQSLRP